MLSEKWMAICDELKQFYEKNHTYIVSKDYTCADGTLLRNWVSQQRKKYHDGKLSEEEISYCKSKEIENFLLTRFELGLQYAREYYIKFGNLCVPTQYICEDGFRLGNWILNLRQTKNKLPEWKIKQLNEIGMVWEFRQSHWEEIYEECKQYFEEHGNLDFPVGYCGKSNVNLSSWVIQAAQRHRKGKLTPEQVQKLTEIGVIKKGYFDRWMDTYEECKAYFLEHGDLKFPEGLRGKNGELLNVWIAGNRYKYGKGKLSEEKIKLLEEIGALKKTKNCNNAVMQKSEIHSETDVRMEKWLTIYQECKNYYAIHDTLCGIEDEQSKSGMDLKKWLSNQRAYARKRTLSDEKIRLLNEIHALDPYDSKSSTRGKRWEKWLSVYQECKNYYAIHGNTRGIGNQQSENGVNLRFWVINQKRLYYAGKLSDEKIKLLQEIGALSDHTEKNDQQWLASYQKCKEYFLFHGSLNGIENEQNDNGINLKQWLSKNKKLYHAKKLSDDQIKMLKEIGALVTNEEYFYQRWLIAYQECKEYYQTNGSFSGIENIKSQLGINLKSWIISNRQKFTRGTLSDEKIQLLQKIHALDSCDPKISFTEKRWAKWLSVYQECKKYYDIHGDVRGIGNQQSENDVNLRFWIITNKRLYQAGRLPDEKIKLLQEIGVFSDREERNAQIWLTAYQKCREYFLLHGSLDGIETEQNAEGIDLKKWISNNKNLYYIKKLSDDQIRMLKEIGALTTREEYVHQRWLTAYRECKAYYQTNGSFSGIEKIQSQLGINLKNWLTLCRKKFNAGILSDEKIQLLQKIHALPEDTYNVNMEKWLKVYQECAEYFHENGSFHGIENVQSKLEVNLKSWLQNNRYNYFMGKLSEEKIKLLSEIDALNPELFGKKKMSRKYEILLHHLEEYQKENQTNDVPTEYVCEDGYPLGIQVRDVRYRPKTLPPELTKKLSEMGLIISKADLNWKINYEACVAYYEQHGDLNIPEEYLSGTGRSLRLWLDTNKRKYEQGRLSEEQAKLLRELGVVNDFPVETEAVSIKFDENDYAMLRHIALKQGYANISRFVRAKIHKRVGIANRT